MSCIARKLEIYNITQQADEHVIKLSEWINKTFVNLTFVNDGSSILYKLGDDEILDYDLYTHDVYLTREVYRQLIDITDLIDYHGYLIVMRYVMYKKFGIDKIFRVYSYNPYNLKNSETVHLNVKQ